MGKPHLNVRYANGAWTVHPQPPLAATSSFITDGWKQIAELRDYHDAVDHFESSDAFEAFCREFGQPPI